MIDVRNNHERAIPAEAVHGLYVEINLWPERTVTDVGRLLTSGPAVGAWHDNRLVGFARAVSDGVCRAYLEDVIVAAEHRGKGIGRRLCEALLADLAGIQVISVFCGEGLVDFYEGAGFHFTGQRIGHRSRSSLRAASVHS